MYVPVYVVTKVTLIVPLRKTDLNLKKILVSEKKDINKKMEHCKKNKIYQINFVKLHQCSTFKK